MCDGGTCRPDRPVTTVFRPISRPATTRLVICISGSGSVPCQNAGTIPFQGLAQFKNAIASALDRWLAATARTPDRSRGAATYSGFNGSEFSATASATCGDATETLTLTVRHL